VQRPPRFSGPFSAHLRYRAYCSLPISGIIWQCLFQSGEALEIASSARGSLGTLSCAPMMCRASRISSNALEEFAIHSISLIAVPSHRLDKWGNTFKYAAEINADPATVRKHSMEIHERGLASDAAKPERTKAGLARTRKAGTRLGRRPAQVDMALVEMRHAGGESLRGIARALQVSPALLIKRRKSASALAN
jgi:hypothetical protein